MSPSSFLHCKHLHYRHRHHPSFFATAGISGWLSGPTHWFILASGFHHLRTLKNVATNAAFKALSPDLKSLLVPGKTD